jgi:hypothetical protein
MTPRNLKHALESDYVIKDIAHAGNKKCLVKVSPRFANAGKKSTSFWMTTTYMKKQYPRQFASKARY